jgi:hypothetical protein
LTEVKTSILGIFNPAQLLKNPQAGFPMIFGAKKQPKNST